MAKITTEDYVRAIYHLEKDNGVAKSIEVAKYLEVSKPTVSEMIRNLESKRLIKFKAYGSILLTKKGAKMAEQLTFKHRIIEGFLQEILKIDGELIHEEAHRLEHAFSDESVVKIRSLLKNKESCPHGEPIPEVMLT